MSDALTDISRDQQRASAYHRYLVAIIHWVESGHGAEQRTAVKEAAEATDLVRGGYWGGGTNISGRIEERLTALETGDPQQWGRLMMEASDEWNPEVKSRLQAASPWKDGALVFADYGIGFVHYQGALDRLIMKAIEARGGTTFHGEKHLLILPADILDQAEVVTLKERRK